MACRMSSGTRSTQQGTVLVKESELFLLQKANQIPLVTCLKDLNLAGVFKHMSDDVLDLSFLLKHPSLVKEKQTLVQLFGDFVITGSLCFAQDNRRVEAQILFCCFTSQVNSYGHCGTVSSPNHTFSWAGLNKRLTSNSCTYFRLKHK